MDGVLVIDKPAGMTSHSVVARVRRALGGVRAGHTGTLDPLATGVLPICLGDATKLAGWLIAADKAYEAELVLGVETTTLDADGEITATHPVHVTEDALRAALAARVGASMQLPPMFSAIRQGRRRLYQLAREGAVVERTPRAIVIHELALLELAPPRARIRVACAKGTYVRSLVDDLGRDLGCGAHLAALRRTRSGTFSLDRAVALDALTPEAARAALIAPVDALPLTRVEVPPERVRSVLTAYKTDVIPLLSGIAEGELFQLVGPDQALLAVGRRRGSSLRFERVFVPLTSRSGSSNVPPPNHLAAALVPTDETAGV